MFRNLDKINFRALYSQIKRPQFAVKDTELLDLYYNTLKNSPITTFRFVDDSFFNKNVVDQLFFNLMNDGVIRGGIYVNCNNYYGGNESPNRWLKETVFGFKSAYSIHRLLSNTIEEFPLPVYIALDNFQNMRRLSEKTQLFVNECELDTLVSKKYKMIFVN